MPCYTKSKKSRTEGPCKNYLKSAIFFHLPLLSAKGSGIIKVNAKSRFLPEKAYKPMIILLILKSERRWSL